MLRLQSRTENGEQNLCFQWMTRILLLWMLIFVAIRTRLLRTLIDALQKDACIAVLC
jgi:hypothetical protein